MNIAQEIQLISAITRRINTPFKWGECDCNVFALEVMDEVYGTALAEKIRGKYSCELSAIRYRLRSEWGSFMGLLIEAGFIEGKKGFERMGDILIVEDPKFELVHIYLGKTVASVPLGMAVRLAPFASAKGLNYRVWRLPRC